MDWGATKQEGIFHMRLSGSSCARGSRAWAFGMICMIINVFASAQNYEALVSGYVKKDSWAETMVASKAAYQQKLKASGKAPAVTMSPWRRTQPIPSNDFNDTAFNPAAPNPNGKEWLPADELVDGRIHDLPGGHSNAATYLTRTLQCPTPITRPASFGSDDGIEVWLNGEKILSNNVPRGVAPNQDRVVLNLKKGTNILFVKVFNISGGHGFYFSAGTNPLQTLLEQINRDFTEDSRRLRSVVSGQELIAWFQDATSVKTEKAVLMRMMKTLGDRARRMRPAYRKLVSDNASWDNVRWLQLMQSGAAILEGAEANRSRLDSLDMAALRRAIAHLTKTYPEHYPSNYLKELVRFEQIMTNLEKESAPALSESFIEEILTFEREALLANPLLADFDEILLIQRGEGQMGLPQNWQGNCSIPSTGYDNEIARLRYKEPNPEIKTLFRPDHLGFVGDVDLHFDGNRMLFSMPGSHARWQIWEIGVDGQNLRQVTPGLYDDVNNYDACYLPDGRIIFDSTRVFHGVPCVGGADTVANLFLMDPDTGAIRQLCFDQDHNWNPTVLNNGRVLFTRWEYSDTSHYFTRLLFHMNPDGTSQTEYYGSNSYWPNAMFYSRPIPGHPTQVVTIVSGHHGVARMGELIILDPAKGRFEADGVVQRIPGYGKKVEPVIVDELVNHSWPKFLHPYPLSDKYVLVASKPTPSALWGIYLVDIFDNMLLLKETPGYALLEPLPLRPTPRPPAVPDRVDLSRQDATIYLIDVYVGQGMKGVPRDTVKNLRLFEMHYAYPNMGGHKHIAIEGAWDVHRILGTVPVEKDGSALFKVPANTPIAVQPLDEAGRAVQVMRSWFTAMPGETLSCVGCHEPQNQAAPPRQTLAAKRPPSPIKEWYGPARGFSFKRDVHQPVIEKYCVGCHDAAHNNRNPQMPDLTAKDQNGWGNFTPAYLELHRYTRRPGPESNYHVEVPYEYCANTSELIQMLEKGHHGVELDDEAWDRLYTWIDLNTPDHGTWGEQSTIPGRWHERRIEMRTRYANRPEDPEAIPDMDLGNRSFVKPAKPPQPSPAKLEVASWPFDTERAKRLQAKAGKPIQHAIDLGAGVTMHMVLIPAGEYIMGSNHETPDEWPITRVTIDKPFWMSATEVTFAQMRRFDPSHSNGVINQQHKDHTTPGYPIEEDTMPAVRISWEQAVAYCEWMSQATGMAVTLPTEAQWEWACRAGSAEPFSFGAAGSDFSSFANLADLATKRLAVTGVNPQPIHNPSDYEAWLPRDNTFNDGYRIMAEVGQLKPNVWGLYDMHGNVAEWTRSDYTDYPYVDGDGRNAMSRETIKAVRGGSWHDRPKRSTASYRLGYLPWQKAHHVGFRVVLEATPGPLDVAAAQ